MLGQAAEAQRTPLIRRYPQWVMKPSVNYTINRCESPNRETQALTAAGPGEMRGCSQGDTIYRSGCNSNLSLCKPKTKLGVLGHLQTQRSRIEIVCGVSRSFYICTGVAELLTCPTRRAGVQCLLLAL